eukprot:m.1116126 g.1116126  ORF g.1116126 m.1116126 type:complete len:548 (+) comp24375_c0_seq4:341-1984(+)
MFAKRTEIVDNVSGFHKLSTTFSLMVVVCAVHTSTMPFNPCGKHGDISGTFCTCHHSCAGEFCEQTGTRSRDTSPYYNYNTCADCFCRPARQRDTIDTPVCPALAPDPSQFLLVICCLPHQNSAVEDMDGRLGSSELAAPETWYKHVHVCYMMLRRTPGYDSEAVEASYLHFIAENYDNLPKRLIFAHVETEWHDQVNKIKLLANDDIVAMPQVSHVAPFVPFPSPYRRFHGSHGNIDDFHGFWKEHIEHFDVAPANVTETHYVPCCSQFVVHSSAIRMHPKLMYASLRAATFSSREASQLMEVSWALLFHRDHASGEPTNVSRVLQTVDQDMTRWRQRALRRFCKPWGCTCQGFSEAFGASGENTVGSASVEQANWWQFGSWDQHAWFIVDAENHSRLDRWTLQSAAGRMSHGVGPCTTAPNSTRGGVITAIAPATVTEGLPRQAIPRIVWQTHHTNKIPVTSRYLFELRRNNPEYTFHFVGDAEADAYMLNFSMKRVSQAYFSINPACGMVVHDGWVALQRALCTVPMTGGVAASMPGVYACVSA